MNKIFKKYISYFLIIMLICGAIPCNSVKVYAKDDDFGLLTVSKDNLSGIYISYGEKVANIALNEINDGTKTDWGAVYKQIGLSNKYNNYSGEAWCAYFVMWCAEQAGVGEYTIPYSVNANELYNLLVENWAEEIDQEDCKPGDLVFYNIGTGKHDSHVGIMVNENESVQGNVYVNGTSCLVKLNRVDLFNYGRYSNVHFIRPEYGTFEETFHYNGYEYSINEDGTIKIVRYSNKDTTITIPEQIDGKNVTIIGEKAFAENKQLVKVSIPKTVTDIQYSSFYKTSSLKEVVLPKNGLEKIESCAFAESGIKRIILPDTLTVIENKAFIKCKKLEQVNFGKKLKYIEAYAFSKDAVLNSIVIPDSVKDISAGAFSECPKLKTAKLGKGLNRISYSMFYKSGLENIKIGSNIKCIESFAFSKTKLKVANIPNSVKNIYGYAFSDCENLKNANIGTGVKVIEEGIFDNCKKLESVKINGKVKTLADFAFQNDKKLKNINIPKTVTEIQYATFKNCSNLKKIKFPSKLEKIGGQTFEGTAWYKTQKNGNIYIGKVYYTYKGTVPATLSIKKGTKGIAGFAFADSKTAKNIKKLSLPKSLTNIGECAFLNCKNLKSVVIPQSVKSIGPYSLGYITYKKGDYAYSPHYDQKVKKVSGFTIYGKKDSVAQQYAIDNGFKFVVK